MTIDPVRSPGEQAAAIRFMSRVNEPVCSLCGGTGWQRVENDNSVRRCACIKARVFAGRLAAVPALFREASFQSYRARDPQQERAAALMKSFPQGSWYLSGHYGTGKTHLLYAQYCDMAVAGKIRCHVRSTKELVEELKKMELENEFTSPVMTASHSCEPYHLFWDDIGKLKLTEFKTEVLFELVDALYRRRHGLTVTGNFSLQELAEAERMHPAIVRRIDDMCRVIEI
jgi:DNA replication protein DnaC